MRLCYAACLVFLPLTSAVVYELSEDNFERLVFRPSTSAAFIKFYAPWCGHCQKLAPDWKKVEKAHGKSTSLLVGSVDCSDGPPQPGAGGPGGGGRNPLCDKYKAMSLPTLMYFTGGKKGFTYEGNKTSDDLIAFAQELSSTCSPSQLDECTDAQKAWFEEYAPMSVEELKTKASDLSMGGEMAKMQMMMLQMQMQEAYQKDKNTKMDAYEGKMKKAGEEIDKSWEESGSLRAMRMVLKEKDGGAAALTELDSFDAMDMMMGGGMGGGRGGPGGGPPKPKKKKKKKAKKAAASSKDEV